VSSSNDKILGERCFFDTEIRSFENCYIGWVTWVVKTIMVSDFLLVVQSIQDYTVI